MVAETFPGALKRVLVYEGGYSNHPADPGGVTLEGVIQRVYDADRRRRGAKPKPLTASMRGTAEWISERNAIYRRQYWDAIKGDELPAGIDFVVFDGAVNSGPSQSVKWLQRALGLSGVDGEIGEITLRAVAEYPDHRELVRAICKRRVAFLKALRTFPTFGKGWMSRVANVQANGLALVSGAAPPGTKYEQGGDAKANSANAKKPPSTTPGDVTASGGVATSTITGASDAIAPLADKSEWLGYLYTGLIIAGVLAVIGGIAWRMWAAREREKLRDALDIQTATIPEAE